MALTPKLVSGTSPKRPRPSGFNAMLLVHKNSTGQACVVPGNITLLELPPYSPELNPVERIWHYLRSLWLANSVFPSLADILDACEMAWNRFATNHGLVRSLCAVAWAPASSAL